MKEPFDDELTEDYEDMLYRAAKYNCFTDKSDELQMLLLTAGNVPPTRTDIILPREEELPF